MSVEGVAGPCPRAAVDSCSSSSPPARGPRPPASSSRGWPTRRTPTGCSGSPPSPTSTSCTTARRPTPTRSGTPPIAQPLLVASALVTALELFPHPADAFTKVGAVAGHSVGELAAAAGARAITAEQAMVLVRERGTRDGPCRGRDPDQHDRRPRRRPRRGARRTRAARADRRQRQRPRARSSPPAPWTSWPRSPRTRRPRPASRRCRSPARSTPSHMAPAVGHDGGARPLGLHPRPAHPGDLQPRRPRRPRRPRACSTGWSAQVASPVRWDLCMETMLDLGVTGMLELPPAGTLTGIARRAMKGVETFALKSPDQLDDARAFVDKHGAPSPIDESPTWRMLVVARPRARSARRRTSPRAASYPSTRRSAPSPGCATRSLVRAPHGGTVIEWLVSDGDPVSPGQPLVRLHPAGVNAMTTLRRRRRGHRTPRSSGWAATGRAASCRTPRSSTPSTPPTSGSSSGPGSSSAASPPPTRPCR